MVEFACPSMTFTHLSDVYDSSWLGSGSVSSPVYLYASVEIQSRLFLSVKDIFSFFFHFFFIFFFWFRKGNKQGRLKDISKGTQLLTNVLFSTCYRGERSLDSISIHFYFDYRLKVGTHYSSDAFPTHNAIWRHDQWHFYFLPQSVSVI